jgi:hypothetical protein
MGCAKKRVNPKIMNHVNRNFNELYTKTVIKAVQQLPLPWKPNKHGRKGHDLNKIIYEMILFAKKYWISKEDCKKFESMDFKKIFHI